jgi:SAM-dependent methyltransferase
MSLLKESLGEMCRRGKIAEEIIALERPDLLELFFTYQNEAVAGRRFLDASLVELKPEAQILEVGGGILALALQLTSEGYGVTSVEPVGEGFSDISYIMDVFIGIAEKEDLEFELIKSPIEDYALNHKFDFIFSVNVMEHLKDPYSVLRQLDRGLNSGGKYRFLCPNYDFPYEPHFGKFLYRRRSNSFVLPRKRARHNSYIDSEGVYNSINWITVRKIRKVSKECSIDIHFNRDAFHDLLTRASADQVIRKRHPLLAIFLTPIRFLKIASFAKFVPVVIQPVIDVTLHRKNDLY